VWCFFCRCEQGWLHVHKALPGADVDKIDYIARDSYMEGHGSQFCFTRLVNHIRVVEGRLAYDLHAMGLSKSTLGARPDLFDQVRPVLLVTRCEACTAQEHK
jgi:HD superfamily phosphohydrolase